MFSTQNVFHKFLFIKTHILLPRLSMFHMDLHLPLVLTDIDKLCTRNCWGDCTFDSSCTFSDTSAGCHLTASAFLFLPAWILKETEKRVFPLPLRFTTRAMQIKRTNDRPTGEKAYIVYFMLILWPGGMGGGASQKRCENPRETGLYLPYPL